MSQHAFTPQETAKVVAVCVAHGYDFKRLAKVQLFPHLCRAFVDGKDTEQSFVANLNKINIFNGGSLKL